MESRPGRESADGSPQRVTTESGAAAMGRLGGFEQPQERYARHLVEHGVDDDFCSRASSGRMPRAFTR